MDAFQRADQRVGAAVSGKFMRRRRAWKRGSRFTNAGGIIAFVYRKNQLRFVINLNAATHAGLRIRSQLLTLAVAVQQAGHR